MKLPFSLATLATTLALAVAGLTASAAEFKTKRILFFSKSSGFEHSVIKWDDKKESHAQKVLREMAPKYNWDITFTKDGSVFTPENIAKYDAFFFYTTGDLTEAGKDGQPPMSKEGKAAFLKAIADGKGFIGSHCATDTFHSPGNKDHGSARFQDDGDNRDPYVKMIGAEFIVHGAQQASPMRSVDKKFPGQANVPADFGPVEEWYSLKDFAPDLHVLMVQETKDMKGNMYQRPPYPATWARKEGKGRVFYTSMGHREDVWTNPVFQEVLAGGINWAVGNVKATVKPNLKETAPGALTLPPAK